MASQSASNATVPAAKKQGARVRSQRRGAYSMNDVKNEDLAQVHQSQLHYGRDKVTHGDQDTAKFQHVHKVFSSSKPVKLEETHLEDEDDEGSTYQSGSDDSEVLERQSTTPSSLEEDTSKESLSVNVESTSCDSLNSCDSEKLRVPAGNKSVLDLIPQLKDTKLVAPTPSEEFRASLNDEEKLVLEAAQKELFPQEYDESTGFYKTPVPAYKRLRNPALKSLYNQTPKSLPNGGYEVFLAPSERRKIGLSTEPTVDPQLKPRPLPVAEPIFWGPGPEVVVPRKSLCRVAPCEENQEGKSGDKINGSIEETAAKTDKSVSGMDLIHEHCYPGARQSTSNPSSSKMDQSELALAADDLNFDRSRFSISPFSNNSDDTDENNSCSSLDQVKDGREVDSTPIRRTKAQIFHH